MSRLLLVRHGQTAGLTSGHYVDLTDLGRAQARALGRHWNARGMHPNRIVVGPLARHAQTWEAIGGAWEVSTEVEPMGELDEHGGVDLLAAVVGGGDGMPESLVSPARDAFARQDRRAVLRSLRDVMTAWVRGEVTAPGGEDWPAFRARAGRALDALCAGEGSGRTVVAVTSGGFVGAATGAVLGTDDLTTLSLCDAVVNASVTEFRFDGTRRSLVRFNATPHLGDEVACTQV